MKKRLFVYSVDALVQEDLEYLKTKPNFKAFLENASGCESIESIYPTITYPVHVSIQTGCYPEKHGVMVNYIFNTQGLSVDWTWDSRLIQCENIFTAAKKAGYTTGAAYWPVTSYNPDIDWHLPEYWLAYPGETLEGAFAERGANADVVRWMQKHCGRLPPSYVLTGEENFTIEPGFDDFMIHVACDMIREKAPEVMFIHGSVVDTFRHQNGVFNAKVTEGLDIVDQWLGELIDAMKDAGVYEETNIVILSDHGQMYAAREMRPNICLADRGLIKLDEQGKVEDYILYGRSNGMSMTFWMKDPENQEDWKRSYETLCQMAEEGLYGFTQVFTRQEAVEKFHLDGDFAFIVEGDGYTIFRNNLKRPITSQYTFKDYVPKRGNHGYLPDQGPQPVFLAKGPDFVPNVMLPRHPIVDEAPTFAKLLGFEMKDAQGTAMLELLR